MLKMVLEYFTNSWYNLINKIGDFGVIKMKKKYDALDISKYLICKFNSKNAQITQLKLQKLLYFIEAYYMAVYDEDGLYKEDFLAWMYGPVIEKVYAKYKIYMSDPIYEDNCDNLITLTDEVIDSIDTVYSAFGFFSAQDLIKITHRKGSPWSNTQNKCIIDKNETREWFKKLFLNGDESD